MSWLGLLLVNIKPRIGQIGIVGLCYAIYAIIIRCFLMLPLDICFALQMPLLLILVMLISRLVLIKSLVATVLGTIVLFLGEVIFSVILLYGLGINPGAAGNTLYFLLTPLPQIFLTSIILYLCIRFKFHLFNFKEATLEPSIPLKNKRLQTIAGLVFILLLVTVVQLVFSMSVMNQEFTLFETLPLSTIAIFSTTVLIMGFAAIVFLILQLVELTQKESEYQMQTLYINTLDELYTTLRSDRHDLINHLQTIYGFNQLGYNKEIKVYLDELIGDGVLSNQLVYMGTPGLTAMFYIKSGIARANGINFNVTVGKKIDSLKIPPYELNNILGNLINNAFDAVRPLDASQRTVNVHIGSDDDNLIFTVSNYGYLSDQVKQNIMRKGFSTKGEGHSGLGLYICRQLAQKYGGSLKVSNTDDHMIEFAVFFPTNQSKGAFNEFDGQKAGSFTG